MRHGPLALLLVAAGCAGGGAEPAPRATEPPAAAAAGPPDAGTVAGHRGGADPGLFDRRAARVRVPESDTSPPLALMRVDTGVGEPIVKASPVAAQPAAAIALPRPSFTATALIRDAEGTGRIRVSATYVTECGGRRQEHGAYFPPAMIENIRVAPGVLIANQRVRSATLRFPADCAVEGKVFAEAQNAHGLESFSDPIVFTWR
jgi:hypothetical protein